MRLLWRRLLALSLGSCVALVGAELVLRVHHTGKSVDRLPAEPKLHRLDTRLGYRTVPGSQRDQIHVNALGLRGADVPKARTPGVMRILCLGDSITWGEQVAGDDETYPAVLARELGNRLGKPVEVLNGGVMGYTSWHCLQMVDELVPGLQPDLVLLCVGWNDLTLSRHLGWYPETSYLSPIDAWEPGESHLFDFLRRRLTSWPPTPNPRALVSYRNNVEAIVDHVRARGAQIAFLDLPTAFAADMDPASVQKVERNGFAASEAKAFLEIATAWRQVAAAKQVPLLHTGFEYEVPHHAEHLADICHPDAQGYREMVARLLPQLQRWLRG